MRPALIGPLYFIFVIERLNRRQLPGYFLTKEQAETVCSTMPNAYINSINAVSYDNGRTFRQICIAGESDTVLRINESKE